MGQFHSVKLDTISERDRKFETAVSANTLLSQGLRKVWQCQHFLSSSDLPLFVDIISIVAPLFHSRVGELAASWVLIKLLQRISPSKDPT